MFLASFVACWHCAFEAQPGMNFLALASTVVTPHNHTVRIARNVSRRRCKYVQMVSSLGFLAPGISGSWSNYVQHALCWPNIIKYPCCQGQPFCSSHGKTVHLATAPGKPGTWLSLKKIAFPWRKVSLGNHHLWKKWRDSHGWASMTRRRAPNSQTPLLGTDTEGWTKNNPKASPGINMYTVYTILKFMVDFF